MLLVHCSVLLRSEYYINLTFLFNASVVQKNIKNWNNNNKQSNLFPFVSVPPIQANTILENIPKKYLWQISITNIIVTVTFFFPHYCGYASPSLFLSTEVMRATQRRVAHPPQPRPVASLLWDYPGRASANIQALPYYWFCSDRRRHPDACPPPRSPPALPWVTACGPLSLSPSCVCGVCFFNVEKL